jgi:tRNA A-37 threonylcarbamoyl transferase component Bud32
MDKRSRSSSPNDANTRHQNEVEQHLPETSASKKVQELRAHHMIAGGQHPDKWQAGTAEASTSGLDRQSAIREESDDELHRQAASYYMQHDYKNAERFYKRFLDSYMQKPKPDDLKIAQAQYGLAKSYKKQGKIEEAKTLCKDVLTIYEREYGSHDPRTEKVRKNLTDLPEKLGQPLESPVGQQQGDYRLVKLLGEGGFAKVYLGEHAHLSMKAAVKVLHQTHLVDQKAKDEFYKEAQTLADLKHPHIVRILNFGVKGDVPYLVMEYAPNGTLRQAHPRDTRLSPTDVTKYVNKIADALQHVHNNGKMHLDLKPDNVLLGAEGQLLLSDFGLAQDIHRTISQPIQEKGTPQYAAPEQLYNGKPRPESDQYALGVMVYEWLSGNRPFYVAPHPDDNLRPERIEGISRKMERVVFKALKPKPEDRYPSVKEFAEAFEQACRDCSLEGSKEQRGLASQLWQIMRRGGGSAERQEVQMQEQVASTDRVPRFGEGDRVLRGEGASSPPTIAEQRLRELWDAVDNAKLLNEEWLNSDDEYRRKRIPSYINYLGPYSSRNIEESHSLEKSMELKSSIGLAKFLLKTRQGKEWCNANGWGGLFEDNYDPKSLYMIANEFIKSQEGQAWLNSDDGHKFRILAMHGIAVGLLADWE